MDVLPRDRLERFRQALGGRLADRGEQLSERHAGLSDLNLVRVDVHADQPHLDQIVQAFAQRQPAEARLALELDCAESGRLAQPPKKAEIGGI